MNLKELGDEWKKVEDFHVFERKLITDVIVIGLMIYIVFFMVTPQGQELNECRSFKPLIEMARQCLTQQDQGRLFCVSQQEYSLRHLTNGTINNITGFVS